jgi:hypothetical protein
VIISARGTKGHITKRQSQFAAPIEIIDGGVGGFNANEQNN